MQWINGVILISNQTVITNQQHFISSYLSTLTISNSLISNITSQGSILSIAGSKVLFEELTVQNINENIHGIFMALSFGSSMVVTGLSYTDSTAKFADVLSSSLEIKDSAF
jgi:hypothetical protein